MLYELLFAYAKKFTGHPAFARKERQTQRKDLRVNHHFRTIRPITFIIFIDVYSDFLNEKTRPKTFFNLVLCERVYEQFLNFPRYFVPGRPFIFPFDSEFICTLYSPWRDTTTYECNHTESKITSYNAAYNKLKTTPPLTLPVVKRSPTTRKRKLHKPYYSPLQK